MPGNARHFFICVVVINPMKNLLVLVLLLIPKLGLAAATADLVFLDGEIYTVNESQPWAQSLAISAGKILFVGDSKGAKKYIANNTQIVKLNGKFMLPGFQDSHIHPVSSALNSYMCSLFGLPGVEAYLQRIRECVKKHPDAEWLHGAGWSHAYFDKANPPTKFMLDKIAADVPISLTSYDGHSLWVNSKALQLSKVDEVTADVSFGRIERLPNSREPSGLLLEDIAQDLVLKTKPAYTREQVYDALLYVQAYLNSLGVTSIQDALVDTQSDGIYGVLPAYQRAAKNDELTVRVVAALYWAPGFKLQNIADLKKIRADYSSRFFRADSVKLWQDGVMHTYTSRLLEDYANKPGERGMSMIPEKQLKQIVTELDKAGFQLHFHADGDGAIRQCLDAIETAIKNNGRRDSRHHIAHLELIHPDDIPRFKALDVVANVQPMWSTSKTYISDLINNKLGPERKPWLQINQSFLDAGATVAYGSDWYVTSPNPMDLLEAAVTRIRPSLPLAEKRQSQPILPGENVTLAQAIKSYTINGAYVNRLEKITGSLEVGKYADLVILDNNLFSIPAVEISDTRVVATFIEGRQVFGNILSQAE